MERLQLTSWHSALRAGRVPAVLGAAAILLSGCSTSRGGSIPYDVKNFQPPDAPKVADSAEEYRIAPADVVNISVFQVPDLSGQFPVDSAGGISLPLLGMVPVAGKTGREVQEDLTRRLISGDIVKQPSVTVAVTGSSSRAVTVDGSVRDPGVYPISGPVSLLQAVALASGADENANLHRVAVFRQVEGRRMAAAFDLESIRRGESEDPKIYSGDIIIVEGSKMKRVQRDLLRTVPLLGLFRPF